MPGLFDQLKRVPGLLENVVGGVGQAITGPADPSLSPAQQEQLRKQAFMRAGLAAMLQSGAQPVAPNLAQIFAQSALTGQQAYQQGAGQIAQQRARQAFQQAAGAGPLDRGKLQQLMVQAVAGGDLETAKLISDQIKALPGPQVLSAGAQLRDSSGALLAENPAGQDPLEHLPPELVGIAQLLGVEPAQLAALPPAQRDRVLAEWRKSKEAGATRVSFNPEAATSKGITELALDDFKQVRARAAAAQSKLNSLSQMQAMLDAGLKTGGLQALTAPLRQLGAQLGYDTENMSQEAVFRALASRMALDSKEGMTGPMSDRDIQFLQRMVPNLANTPEGNRMLITVMGRLAQRDIALAAEANRYLATHRSLDAGWFQHVDDWARGHSLFGDLIAPWDRGR